MILFLIGYMGSGKSSLGRTVARETGFDFVDTDAQIEKECGATVSEIFAAQGEEHFRALERDVLQKAAAAQTDTIVATGGGAPCFGDNMDVMNAAGKTVYLKMSPRCLVQRLGRGREKRPIIRGMDDRQLLAFIEEKLPEREKFYGRASMVINCDGVSDAYVAGHIREYISQRRKTNAS